MNILAKHGINAEVNVNPKWKAPGVKPRKKLNTSTRAPVIKARNGLAIKPITIRIIMVKEILICPNRGKKTIKRAKILTIIAKAIKNDKRVIVFIEILNTSFFCKNSFNDLIFFIFI